MPRFFHKWYAKAFGYTWQACPICGEYFGGHEILDKKTHRVTDIEGNVWPVCTKASCNEEAIRRNVNKWYEKTKNSTRDSC